MKSDIDAKLLIQFHLTLCMPIIRIILIDFYADIFAELERPSLVELGNPVLSELGNPCLAELENSCLAELVNPGLVELEYSGLAELRNPGLAELGNSCADELVNFSLSPNRFVRYLSQIKGAFLSPCS